MFDTIVSSNLSCTLSLPDRADAFGNGAYQEMKAEVTEFAASHLIPEGNRSLTGSFTDVDSGSN